MYNYALGIVPAQPYIFRNGARVRIARGVDHVPIIEVFLKQDYGSIPRDSVIIDLGASIGVFSIYAAASSTGSRIYAYEPMPAFYHLLRENVRLNRTGGRIRCFNIAAAGRAQTRTLYVSGTHFQFPTCVRPEEPEPSQQLSVPCITLAEILESNQLERVDLLKMDIEGSEYEVLYETTASVFARIREIRMEYHNLGSNGRNAPELQKFLTHRGYAITYWHATSDANGNLWASRRV
jgi:FkbM family methyltransferase